jgi:transposase
VGWPPPADLDDAALETLLYPRPKPGIEVHPTPDFEWIERELGRKHVTRRQLWREYLARYPDGLKYTAFCVKFRQWRWRRGVTMSLTHLPGDRLFVDYAGDPASYTDPTTGIAQKAWIFVAVWPYSGLFYAEATRTQTSVDWLGAHVRALEAFGAAPKAIVPDNCKTAVKKALRCNPEFNRSYSDFAQTYSLAVLPARVKNPATRPRSSREYSWPSARSSGACATRSSSAWPNSMLRSPRSSPRSTPRRSKSGRVVVRASSTPRRGMRKQRTWKFARQAAWASAAPIKDLPANVGFEAVKLNRSITAVVKGCPISARHR